MGALIENAAIEVLAVPIDTNGAVVASDWISLKLYRHATIIITQGAWAGGTPAVTLDQATAVAGTGTKTLEFETMWTQTGLTGTGYTKTAVTSDTFNLTATANSMTIIEIDAEDLDQAGGFTSFQLDIASPGANADLIAAIVILTEPVYKRASMPDAKVD